jgi:hypothetical protein
VFKISELVLHKFCEIVGYKAIHYSAFRSFQIIHSLRWVLLEKLSIVQLLKNFPACYGIRRFITVFTRALHRSLFWARSIQSIPSHPIYLRSILILFTHLRLGLPSGLFPSGIPTNILYTFLFFPHSCYMPCPSRPPWRPPGMEDNCQCIK